MCSGLHAISLGSLHCKQKLAEMGAFPAYEPLKPPCPNHLLRGSGVKSAHVVVKRPLLNEGVYERHDLVKLPTEF